MPRTFIYILLILLSIFLSLALLGLSVELLIHTPFLPIAELKAAYMQSYISPTGLVEVISRHIGLYLFILTHNWILWSLPIIAVLISLFLASRCSKGQSSRLKEQIYFLEQNLERISKFENESRDLIENSHSSIFEAFEESPSALLHVSNELLIQHLNLGAERMLAEWNNSESQFARRLLQDVITGYESSDLSSAVRQCLQMGKPWGGEIYFTQQDCWVDARIFVAKDGVYILLNDTTYQHTEGDKVKHAEVLLEQIVANSISGVAVLDDNWRYLAVSNSWKDIFGVGSKDIINIFHYEALPAFPTDWDRIRTQAESGRVLEKATESFTVQGNEKWFSWKIKPWINEFYKTGGFLIFAEDITEIYQARSRLEHLEEQENKLAYHDLLTGLPNRQLFYDRLNMALANAYRQLSKVGLLFLDLDGFKTINDTLGHEVGDMLLKEVAVRLEECVRQTDTVCRLGGDEFTIIVNVQDEADCAMIAEKITNRINEPYSLAGNDNVRVSTSIGISMYPKDGGAAADLIRKADNAMYVAKNGGKNRYIFFKEE